MVLLQQYRQLNDIARNAPRFVHYQHLGCVSIGPSLARIDVASAWPITSFTT
jgi:hypothetical protein